MIFRLIKFLVLRATMGQEPWKIRQRVELELGYYAPSRMNPCKTSEYACEGTVIEIRDKNALVKWDTGHTTAYMIKSNLYYPLSICNFPIKLKSFKVKLANMNDNNPNMAFKKQKEWQQIQNNGGLLRNEINAG